jgi:hypothetical protein
MFARKLVVGAFVLSSFYSPVPSWAAIEALEPGLNRLVEAAADEEVMLVSNSSILRLLPSSAARVTYEGGIISVDVQRGSVTASRGASSPNLSVSIGEVLVELDESVTVEVLSQPVARVRHLSGTGGAVVYAGGQERRISMAGFEVSLVDASLSSPGLAGFQASTRTPARLEESLDAQSNNEEATRNVVDETLAAQAVLGYPSASAATLPASGVTTIDQPRLTLPAAPDTARNGNSPSRVLAQDRAPTTSPDQPELTRSAAPSTNRLFASQIPFTQPILGVRQPVAVNAVNGSSLEESSDLQYVFFGTSGQIMGLHLGLDLAANRPAIPSNELPGGREDGAFGGALVLPLGTQVVDEGDGMLTDPGISLADDGVASGLPGGEISIPALDFVHRGFFADGATKYRVLQTGFACSAPEACAAAQTPPANFSMTRSDDNFLLIEARPDVPSAAEEFQHFIFATGDVAQRASLPQRVDRFFVSAGLTDYLERDDPNLTSGSGSSIRAFLRNETVPNDPTLSTPGPGQLTDQGLFVIYPEGALSNPFVHVDFGLFGDDAQQTSTISATLGELVTSDLDADRILASATGRTVGSSRLASDRAVLGAQSGLFSSSFGGGNPSLRDSTCADDADNCLRTGSVGYLVLENFDPTDPAARGIESTVADTSESEYALLRLASAIDSDYGPGASLDLETKESSNMTGWLSGFVETGDASTVQFIHVNSGSQPGLTLVADEVTATASATVDFAQPGIPSLSLGGTGASAFLENDRLAARDGQSALVSSGFLAPGLPSRPDGSDVPDYQHVKWGFFFGDLTLSGELGKAHLVSWAAGVPSATADLPTTSSASFSGHAVGNVVGENGEAYVALGSFDQTWNFGTRQGNTVMQFDGVRYNGAASLAPGAQALFNGDLIASGINRRGTLRGSFVGGSADGAAGVIGRFDIRGDISSDYRAAGTFAGE